MSSTERAALMALLAQMRDTYDSLIAYNAGISILHLDAAVVALENRLQRSGASHAEQSRTSHAHSQVH